MPVAISWFLTLPFGLFLCMVATGPVLYPHWWHRNYWKIAIALALGMTTYYVQVLQDRHTPLETLIEYGQFILLIGALFMVSGTVQLRFHLAPTPRNNLMILWAGALTANLLGTSGSSLLFIHPFMHMNRKRLAPYLIIFFIFMVSNVGGVLTFIGDPPTVLAWLRGVDPWWFPLWGFFPWFVILSGLSLFFYHIDRNAAPPIAADTFPSDHPKITIAGKRYLPLFAAIAGAVFIDPNKWDAIPAIHWHGSPISFIREILWLLIALFAYFGGDRRILKANRFTLAPLKEVVFVFIGIFFTMMPALALMKGYSAHHGDLIGQHLLYWVVGALSSFLDNAPTFLIFLTSSMQAQGLDSSHIADVAAYARDFPHLLRALLLGAVFFGAGSYVGNAPNMLLRAIAAEQGIRMPSFGRYIWSYSLRFLLPLLLLIWCCFI